MATLNIINNFEAALLGGAEVFGKQGSADDGLLDAFSITITGPSHLVPGQLSTATVVTVYDDDNDVPTDWDYLFFWSDQDCYLQAVASATNVVHKIKAKVPFTLGYDSLLAAADTTIITGGSEPSVTDIDSIVIGNYSGNTMNYLFAVFD